MSTFDTRLVMIMWVHSCNLVDWTAFSEYCGSTPSKFKTKWSVKCEMWKKQNEVLTLLAVGPPLAVLQCVCVLVSDVLILPEFAFSTKHTLFRFAASKATQHARVEEDGGGGQGGVATNEWGAMGETVLHSTFFTESHGGKNNYCNSWKCLHASTL